MVRELYLTLVNFLSADGLGSLDLEVVLGGQVVSTDIV